jgi:hypothetical protein
MHTVACERSNEADHEHLQTFRLGHHQGEERLDSSFIGEHEPVVLGIVCINPNNES